MYESITYAELKNLPKEQKANAWRELKNLYATQKELAEKLGVRPAIVYNMISRYAKDATRNRRNNKLEILDEPKAAGRKSRRQVLQAAPEENIAAESIDTVTPEIIDTKDDTFSIVIRKLISGEEAQFFLSGVGNTLLKNQKYLIEMNIAEA
jgi:transposase-like protein